MPPSRYFAPPPVSWSGRPPGGGQSVGGGARVGAVQCHATFAPLRVGRADRAPPGDELVRVQGETFLVKTAARGLQVKPDGLYNFVRTVGDRPSDKRTFLSARSGHASLANGHPVLYAGTVRFDGGRLDWWSNYSGTYQPMAAFRQQAELPEDRFVPWQRLQMGGVGLQRTMLSDHRTSARPEAGVQSVKNAAPSQKPMGSNVKDANGGATPTPPTSSIPSAPASASGSPSGTQGGPSAGIKVRSSGQRATQQQT